MFIDLNITKHPAPCGGAGRGLDGTSLLEFRSYARRRMGDGRKSYKYLTPHGVKTKRVLAPLL
jgi:hypothetical protein